jgi:hypothetical protein
LVVVAWTASVLGVIPAVRSSPPTIVEATHIACTADPAADEIDWSRPAPGSITRNPFKLLSRADHTLGAFVWCTSKNAHRLQIDRQMNDLQVMSVANETGDDLDEDDSSQPDQRLRLGVVMSAPADFAVLRRFLCEAGCEVAALPYGSMDPRLRMSR